LSSQNVYGFGYHRADGFWVIDPGSKRPTMPEQEKAVDAPPTTAAAAVTASN